MARRRLLQRAENPGVWRVLVGAETSEDAANRLAERIRQDSVEKSPASSYELIQRRRNNMASAPSRWAHGLVGQSPPIAAIRRLIEKASANRLPVLLLGESGTGKEVVARAIHNANPRGQFVPIDCGSLVGTLMESELFGHVKGAFSGAVENKTGTGRTGRRRHRLLRRDRRPAARNAGETAAPDPGARIPRRGLAAMAQGGPADHRRDPSQPQAKRWPPGASGWTCSTASTSSPFACRPCASARRTFRCWWITF